MKNIFILLFLVITFNTNAATRWAVANGNWSAVGTWDGGVAVPTAGDVVYADGKTVTINQNITVGSINTTQRVGGTTGGAFQTTAAASYTLTCDVNAGSNTCLTTTVPVGYTITINGNITGGTSANQYGVFINGAGNVIINGNATGGSSSNTVAISIVGIGTHTLTGNATSGTMGFAVQLSTACIFNYSGTATSMGAYVIVNTGVGTVNCTATTLVASGGSVLENLGTGIINFTGNATVNGAYTNIFNSNGTLNFTGNGYGSTSGGSPSFSTLIRSDAGVVHIYGNLTMYDVACTNGLIYMNGATLLTVSQNVTAGSVANSMAININAVTEVDVTGNVTAGASTTSRAIYSTVANNVVDIAGTITGTATCQAVYLTGATNTLKLRGNTVYTGGLPPYYISATSLIKCGTSGAQTITQQDASGTNHNFTTVPSGYPAITDVRSGTIYGNSSEFTGTCIVPLPAYVSLGVNVDATVGTLTITPSDFWGYPRTSITTINSIGVYLKNASTISTVNSQLDSLLP